MSFPSFFEIALALAIILRLIVACADMGGDSPAHMRLLAADVLHAQEEDEEKFFDCEDQGLELFVPTSISLDKLRVDLLTELPRTHHLRTRVDGSFTGRLLSSQPPGLLGHVDIAASKKKRASRIDRKDFPRMIIEVRQLLHMNNTTWQGEDRSHQNKTLMKRWQKHRKLKLTPPGVTVRRQNENRLHNRVASRTTGLTLSRSHVETGQLNREYLSRQAAGDVKGRPVIDTEAEEA